MNCRHVILFAVNQARYPVLLVAAFLVILSGCATVGPDYRRPELNPPENWKGPAENLPAAGEASPGDLVAWWRTFEDPLLTGLIETALAQNLDLEAAGARIREARARRGGEGAARYPSLDSKGAITSSKRGGEARQELYNSGLNAGWEIDLFGGVKRSVEAAQADLEAAEAGYYEAMVSLTAEVALNYLEYRTLEERLRLAGENLNAQVEARQLAAWRYQAGMTTALDVERAAANLESTRAGIPSLKSSLAAAENRLAVLLGKSPAAFAVDPDHPVSIPLPPAAIAVGIPAETLSRRPDIRRAERELAAETARIGTATADLYPRLSLLGSIGLDALSTGSFFTRGSFSDSFGPSLSWKAFDAGAVRQGIRAREAARDRSLASYQAAVLAALEEVETALVAYDEEQKRLEALLRAQAAAEEAAALAVSQYTAGLVDFQTVLDAQRSLLSIQDQRAASQGAVGAGLIRLYKAVGGGWDTGGQAAEPLFSRSDVRSRNR